MRRRKKVCKTLNYNDNLLFLASIVARYVSISAFTSLAGILIGIVS